MPDILPDYISQILDAAESEDVKKVLIGDIRWFTKFLCINTPNWRRALKPGRGLLVGRIEEMNTENLIEPPTPLPDHVTHPV